jgi:hypothetical protein
MAALEMTAGDSRQFQLTVTKSGQPVDLTGVQALTFTLQHVGGVVAATWPLGAGVTVNSPSTAGLATLTVTPSMTAFATTFLQLYYTWSLVDSLGNVTQALDMGTFTLTPAP